MPETMANGKVIVIDAPLAVLFGKEAAWVVAAGAVVARAVVVA
jgi:hypothetical protein